MIAPSGIGDIIFFALACLYAAVAISAYCLGIYLAVWTGIQRKRITPQQAE